MESGGQARGAGQEFPGLFLTMVAMNSGPGGECGLPEKRFGLVDTVRLSFHEGSAPGPEFE
jgi:hypothetical protein